MPTRKYLNGFPMLIMLSIRSRENKVTAFEIENDMEDTTCHRPSSGAVYSALGRMSLYRQIVQCTEAIEGKETNVFSLTDTGSQLIEDMLQSVEDLKVIKREEDRGPRVSGAARRRRRRRPTAQPRGEGKQ